MTTNVDKIKAFDWIEEQLIKSSIDMNVVAFFQHCSWGGKADKNGVLEKFYCFSINDGKEYSTLIKAIKAEMKKKENKGENSE